MRRFLTTAVMATLHLVFATMAWGQVARWTPADTADAGLSTALESRFGGRTPIAQAIQSPDASLMIVSVWPPAIDEDAYGPTIVLLRRDATGYTALADVGRLMDTYAPALVAWEIGQQSLLLASVGDENAWGLVTANVSAATLGNQAFFDIVTPAGDGLYGDPTPHMRPSLAAGKWCLAVDTAIILFPLKSGERRLQGLPAAPLYFRQSGSMWDLVGSCL